MWTCASIAAGFIIDLIVGDPHGIPHPVVGIGRLIAALEKLLRRLLPKTKAGEIAAIALLQDLNYKKSFLRTMLPTVWQITVPRR